MHERHFNCDFSEYEEDCSLSSEIALTQGEGVSLELSIASGYLIKMLIFSLSTPALNKEKDKQTW